METVKEQEKRYDETLAKMKEHLKNKTAVIKEDHSIEDDSFDHEFGTEKIPLYVLGNLTVTFPEIFNPDDVELASKENVEMFKPYFYGENFEEIVVDDVFIKDGKTTVTVSYYADPINDYTGDL